VGSFIGEVVFSGVVRAVASKGGVCIGGVALVYGDGSMDGEVETFFDSAMLA